VARNKLICLIIGAVMGLCFAHHQVNASSLDCEGIRDADHRNMCRAIAKNDRAYCEFIKAQELRAECRARAGN
jgi:hypothetical protein